MKPYRISEEYAPKIRAWLDAKRGVAVWQNADLGSPSVGQLAFTPAITDGAASPSPHWRFGNSPVDITHDPADFVVETVAPGPLVKVRRGPPFLGGIHRRDRDKLDAALEAAGPGSFWKYEEEACREYGSAWFGVRVFSIVGTRPL